MDEERTERDQERRDYEAPELTVIASVEEATLGSAEDGADQGGFFGISTQ
ncbi:MAG: hypothetical protein QOF37_1943 [Thermoleophilaceae bacterium]|jgi:hypothetical protein|nr:hypothetical protein [Thermoleophilaceae bacterium]